VVTDQATFGYLADVFVLPEYRGRGYSRRLMDAIMAHPGVQGLRRFMLATSDAHGLYAQYGFAAPGKPQSLMERYVPDIYRSGW
jgi:GNAT superfamily N-acetyltransferase